MGAGDLFYIALAVNPIGGLAIAIPYAVIELRYPAWLALLTGIPLAYVQVVAVDLGWTTLSRWPRFVSLVESRRSGRLERLAASGGAFLSTAVLAPIAGPWLVMALMRYARVPQRRVIAPILLGISVTAAATAVLSTCVPSFFHRHTAGW